MSVHLGGREMNVLEHFGRVSKRKGLVHTNRIEVWSVLLILALLCLPSPARSAIVVDVIDRGVPVGFSESLTGYRGYTLLIRSTTPLLSLDLRNNDDGLPDWIQGVLVQRYGRTGDDVVFTIPDPIGATQQNLVPDDLNFDSHFLIDPTVASLSNGFEWYNPRFGLVLAAGQSGQFRYIDTFSPSPPISPIDLLRVPSFLEANITFNQSRPLYEYEFAYLVTRYGFFVSLTTRSEEFPNGFVTVTPVYVPEPSTVLFGCLVVLPLARRHR
jgi:hypothetical protein